MGDRALKTWISDKLMSLLGYSQTTVVQYIIGISKQANSSNDVLGRLSEFGFSTSSETRSFAKELFSRVPHKQSGLNNYQKQEREAAMLARKQTTYAILDADDDDNNNGDATTSGKTSSITVASERRRDESHKKRFRKKIESEEDEDNEVSQVVNERKVKQRISQDEEDGSESEEERLQDQREREQLEQNIRERDAAGTRNLIEPKITKKEAEEVVRRSHALEENGIGTLRKVSRQEYLKKREQQKMEELRDDIEDEQYLFNGVKLTEAEKSALRRIEKVYLYTNSETIYLRLLRSIRFLL